jgi:hypothetical protein
MPCAGEVKFTAGEHKSTGWYMMVRAIDTQWLTQYGQPINSPNQLLFDSIAFRTPSSARDFAMVMEMAPFANDKATMATQASVP